MIGYKLLTCSIVFFLLLCRGAQTAEFVDLGPFSGKVIDADTKEPIEEAVVIVYWRQRHPFSGSTFIDAQETLTDKNGVFRLSGIRIFNPWKKLTTLAALGVYKSGYDSVKAAAWKKWENATRFRNVTIVEKEMVILLKKMTQEEREKKLPDDPAISVPPPKRTFLTKEREKDFKFFKEHGRAK
jgi:hypothetical protein